MDVIQWSVLVKCSGRPRNGVFVQVRTPDSCGKSGEGLG